MDEKEAEARPLMGTIFLVAWLAVVLGINSRSNAGSNFMRRSRVKFPAYVLIITTTTIIIIVIVIIIPHSQRVCKVYPC